MRAGNQRRGERPRVACPRRARERQRGGLPLVGGAPKPARRRFPDPAQRRPPPLARLLFALPSLHLHPLFRFWGCTPAATSPLPDPPPRAHTGLGAVPGPRRSPVCDQPPSRCRTKKPGLPMRLRPSGSQHGSGRCHQGVSRPPRLRSRASACTRPLSLAGVSGGKWFRCPGCVCCHWGSRSTHVK